MYATTRVLATAATTIRHPRAWRLSRDLRGSGVFAGVQLHERLCTPRPLTDRRRGAARPAHASGCIAFSARRASPLLAARRRSDVLGHLDGPSPNSEGTSILASGVRVRQLSAEPQGGDPPRLAAGRHRTLGASPSSACRARRRETLPFNPAPLWHETPQDRAARGLAGHEHPRVPGKVLLRSYGAPVSDGRVVTRAEEAKTAAGEMDGPIWVVKAQIHAGGRGKGHFAEADAGEKGGVRITKSVEEAAEEAKKMLGRTPSHAPDRRIGQAGRPRLHRGWLGHSARALPGAPRRPPNLPHLLRLLDRGRHGHRGGGREDAGEDPLVLCRPRHRLPAVPWPPHRLRARARGQAGEAMRRADGHPLQTLRREGRRDGRDQSADRDRRGRPQVPRRQDGLRRQRDVPPAGYREPPRRVRRGPQGVAGVEVRPELHRPRRRDRLHGQRRRPRHGDDGHHQALRLRARRTSSTSAAAPRRRR